MKPVAQPSWFGDKFLPVEYLMSYKSSREVCGSGSVIIVM